MTVVHETRIFQLTGILPIFEI